MSRVILVSNRVGDLSKASQSGGLVTAVADVLQEGSGIWFGWSGDVIEGEGQPGLHLERQQNVTIATQPLTQAEYEGYYLGYSNRALWPVFHYRLDLAVFDADEAACYKAVNRRMAQALGGLVTNDDLIWIHDYHMIPLGADLRGIGVENRIGFFLHIPFPPPEIISAVPDHEWLMDALFAYDVIGFQTEQDCQNFSRYISLTANDVTPETHPQRAAGREPLIKAYPIGIDADAFHAMATTPEAESRIRQLVRGAITNHIIGVDRLDYSKGLPDRFRAFRKLLERYPEHRKNTVLMQIAPPTRGELSAYADIRTELEQLSGAINGAYGDFDWTPIRYVHRALPRETLAALFRGSKIGLVTPLRDGMNLVAKEYVAAQDEDDPGVLVLSQFAGAAADLKEAIIVNPHDPEEVAAAIDQAIRMDLEERKSRHRALNARVHEHDAAAWRNAFLTDLKGGAAH